MSLKVVGSDVVAGESNEKASKKAPTAKEKVAIKKAREEEKKDQEGSEIHISDGQVLNLKFKKDSYFFTVMSKLAQKADLQRQVSGWKLKTKKAKELIKGIDTDLEEIEAHYEKNKSHIK